jgi:hypothetical protein
VIVFRCAQGVVVFRTAPHATTKGKAVICLNDRAVFQVPRTPLNAPVAALQSMLDHAITLRGAVQQVFELSLD